MRVALFARVPEAVVHLDAAVRGLGHESVGVVTSPGPAGRYGAEPFSALVDAAALLPKLRGPNPIGWALRNGDAEIGFTYHRMDEDLDTGAILAQGSAPLADAEGPEDVVTRIVGLAAALLPQALARVEAGDPGDVQDASEASHAGFFEPEFAETDWRRPAEEVHRQVRAWWVAAVREGPRGALAELDEERVRVLRTRLDDREGGRRVECGDGPIWVVETARA
jgi:methionyl-tRNA formyltransferase